MRTQKTIKRSIQYEDEIEQIILPVPTQFQDNEYGYKDTEEVTDCGNDTDNTDNTLLYKFITACNIY